MLFNSFDFAIFLPVVFTIYWLLLKNLKFQNIFIVIASYVFYASWDYRFLLLIILSTVIDYVIANRIFEEQNVIKRKYLLWVSLFANLGFLAFFKYCNFFVDNFVEVFSFFNIQFRPDTLNIILPVGISFYTFQTLSYTIDVYRNAIKPTKNIIVFASYVCFFPQLVAGPIERSTNLLPQFTKKRFFNYEKSVDGLRQILWGFFKKAVIADNCAFFVDEFFGNYTAYSGSTLFLGAVLFAFQIYGDFSGYSDMAIGMSRLFGFDLKQNFRFPYFSRDIAEFWRRWHISLSTWFRDYLYIPLGGSRGGTWHVLRNTFIIFVVSGFWHGANWTFIAWGALNAIYFIPLALAKANRKNLNDVAEGGFLPSLKELFQILVTFILTVFAWIFFRSETIVFAYQYISKILSLSFFEIPLCYLKNKDVVPVLILISLMMIIEWVGRKQKHALGNIDGYLNRPLRWVFYSFLIFLIGMFMKTEESPFIYFQF